MAWLIALVSLCPLYGSAAFMGMMKAEQAGQDGMALRQVSRWLKTWSCNAGEKIRMFARSGCWRSNKVNSTNDVIDQAGFLSTKEVAATKGVPSYVESVL